MYFQTPIPEFADSTNWCAAPGCEFVVDLVMGSGNYDICCNCSYKFYWNCTKEAHRPVDCSTVAMWILTNSRESENMNWEDIKILANSKPCLKCKRPIEKNQGCMHFTCTPPCKFEFCCMMKLRRREMAKNSLERYPNYYERWATNQSRGFRSWRKKAAETQASAWEVSETTKSVSKFKREEAKITAWENLHKAKAEADVRKLEIE
ncbi:hypothetical protein AAC387_Pa06g1634 [Persea americana]